MATSTHPRPPPLPHDHVGISRLKPREKAFLLRQRFLELGVDAECRRLNGSSESLPPVAEFEILFSQAPALTRLWEDFLLRVFAAPEVKLIRKNLSVANVRNKMAEAERAKEEKRRRAKELSDELAEMVKKIESKDKLLLSKQSRLKDKSGKLRLSREERHFAAVDGNLLRSKHSAATKYADGEKRLRAEKLRPIADRLADFHAILTTADGVDDRGEREDNDGCRRELRVAFEAVKASLSHQLDDLRDDRHGSSPLDASGEKIDGSFGGPNDVVNGVIADPFPHFDVVQRLLRSHSRASIVDALVAETTVGIQRLKEAESDAGQLDPNEASRLDCSVDDSGVIVDESARREEKELRQRRDAARRALQLKILQIEDEATRCTKRNEEFRNSSVSDGSSQFDASIRLQVQRSSRQLLEEEIAVMERFVDEAGGREEALREKREKVEAAKDAMKLTDNMIAALAQGTTQIRAAIKNAERADVSFDVAAMKEAAKDIRLKSAALEGSGRQALRTWSSLRVDQLPAHVVETRIGEGKSSLVRDSDLVPRLSDAARRALEDRVAVPPSRHNLSHVIGSMTERENECRRKEASVEERPEIKSLAPLEVAVEAWNVEKAIKFGVSCDENDRTVERRGTQRNGSAGNLHDSNKNNKEANLAEAKRVMSLVMERCVKLAAGEKTLDEEGGFCVLPDAKIDGKNWEEWKAELNDAKMRYELAKK